MTDHGSDDLSTRYSDETNLHATRGRLLDDSTQLSMLDGLRLGDDSAWERFAKIFTPVIYGMLRKKGLSEHDAVDIGQEVLIKVQSQLGNFVRDGKKQRLRYWLTSVTHSVFIDACRKRKKNVEPIGGSDFHALLQKSPDQWWDHVTQQDFEITPSDATVAVRAALKLLEPKFNKNSWRCFYATQILKRSSQEIADELGLTDNAVRQAALRIKRKLAEELGGLVDLQSPT